MKTKLQSSVLTALNLAVALFAFATLPAGAAGTTYYWDCNSTTSGFGTASGTWGTDSFLSTSSAGTGTPSNPTTATSDTLNIGTTTIPIIGGTVGVNGTQVIQNLRVDSSSPLTLGSSGTIISLTAANPNWNNFGSSLWTINSDIANSASGTTLAINSAAGANGDITVNGNITWSGTSILVTKQGAGSTLTLNGTGSTYTSATTVSAGTLVAGGNVPASANSVFGNASTAINVGNAGTGASDAPTLLIGGGYTVGRGISVGTSLATAYTATIGTINSGTATINNIMALSAANPLYNTILQAVPGGTLNIKTGTWQNSGNHPVTIGSSGNTGTVKIENQLQGNGNVTVNAGTLQVTYTGGFGGGGIYSSLNYGIGGTVAPLSGVSTATLDFNSAGGAVTHDYPLTLNGTLNNSSGTAVLVNSAAGTTTTLSSGLVKGVPITAGGSGYSAADTIGFSGGGGSSATASLGFSLNQSTISVTGGGTGWVTGNTLSVGGGGSTVSAVYTVTAPSGAISSLTLVQGGQGFTSLTGLTYTGAKGSSGSAFAGTGATFSATDGKLSISGVKVTASGSGYTTAPSTSITTSTGSGATFGTAVLNSLALVGTGNQIGSGTDGNLTVNCPVTGSGGGFTKSGSGTLTLSAANTYSGDTTISAGTLKLDTAGAIPSSPNIIVGSGGTLDVSTKTVAMALSSQKLKASATGSTTTGTINLATSHGLTLDATAGKGVEFTAYNGGATAPLTLSGSGGSLALNGAPIKVDTGSSLAAPSTYWTLIAHGGSATVSGTPGSLDLSGGNGLAFNGALVVSSAGDLLLSPYYSVTFDAQGGTVSPSTISATNGLTYGTLPTPSRSGFAFNGWFTAASVGTQVTSGTTVSLTGSQTLYAQWTASATPTKLVITSVPTTTSAGNTFTVIVQAQDGSGNPGNVTTDTGISLAASGSGTLSGNTATILNNQNAVTLTGVTYTKAEAITLTASQTSGTPSLANSVASSSITVIPNAPSAATSTVVASPATLAADNSSLSTVTITLKDANNNTLGAGTNVTWSSTGTGNTLSPVSSGTTSSSGVASFTIKSTKAETKTVTVNVGATVITNLLQITFTTPSTGNSFTWDPALNGSGSDAAGTWDTSTVNWANGLADFAWPNNGNDNAIFGTGAALGANYAIAMGAPVTVGNLTFNTTGANQYTLGNQQPITLTANSTVNVAGAAKINSPLVGNGSLTKIGSGTLTFGQTSNSFTGGITIKNGTFTAGNNANNLGTGPVTLGDAAGGPATLIFDWNTYTNPITLGASAVAPVTLTDVGNANPQVKGGINLNGNNLNILKSGGNGANSALNISTTDITGAGSLTLSNVNVAGNGTITISAPVNITGAITNVGVGTNATAISGNIGSTVTAVVQNSATAGLTLSGSNTFSSGLYINAGTVTASTSTNALGGSGLGTVYLGDTSGSANATLLFNFVTGGFANPITVRSGSSGTLTISATGFAPLAGAITQNNPFTAYPIGNKNIIFNGPITGSSQITLTNDTGTGIVTFNADNSTWTGPLVVGNGTFRTQKSNALGTNNTVQLYPGTIFDTYFQNPTIAGLNGVGGSLVTNVSAGYTTTLTVGGSGTYSFGGVIGDGGGVNKMALTMAGSGTQTLSGVNTYSGTTTIGSGTLALSGSGSIANSLNMSNAPAATFDVSAISGSSYALPTGTLTLKINKTGSTLTQGQINLGAKNLTYAGTLTVVSNDNSAAFASGDSFTLVSKTTGTLGGWFSSVSLPSLAAGISWDTNDLATTGVLDVYNFTTTPLTLNTASNTAAMVSALKLANHVTASRGTPQLIAGTQTTANGTATVDGSGNLTYTPNTGYGGGSTDTFNVVFSDGHGTQTLAVSAIVGQVASSGNSPNIISSGLVGGSFVATYAGIPGDIYTIEYSTSLTVPVTWTKLGANVTADLVTGVITITDPVNTTGTGRYYRTVSPSY